jgi:hypothetical protein
MSTMVVEMARCGRRGSHLGWSEEEGFEGVGEPADRILLAWRSGCGDHLAIGLV